ERPRNEPGVDASRAGEKAGRRPACLDVDLVPPRSPNRERRAGGCDVVLLHVDTDVVQSLRRECVGFGFGNGGPDGEDRLLAGHAGTGICGWRASLSMYSKQRFTAPRTLLLARLRSTMPSNPPKARWARR